MYESFYGLQKKPFQLSPDPRFFFNSKGHKRALAYLRYGVKQGDGFIIITGDVGTGKTTLVEALSRFLSNENVVAANLVTTQLEANDLLRMVAAAYGLAYEGITKARLLKSLQNYFLVCANEGKRMLLVVDEVQNLPDESMEELRMLSNLQWRNRPLLQSFLLGQREFRFTLRSERFEQLRQRVIAAYHLQPLDSAETRNYIKHRLLTAGWQGDPTLDEEIFPEIYDFTGGVPRRINTLCDRLLLYGYLGEDHALGLEQLEAVSKDLISEVSGPSENLAEAAPFIDDVPALTDKQPAKPAVEEHLKYETDRTSPVNETDRITQLEASVKAMQDEMSRLLKALENARRKGSYGGTGNGEGN